MSQSIRPIAVMLALAMPVALWAAAGKAAGDKTPKWKPFLPAEAYKELSRRAVERIRTLAKDEDGAMELRAEALILAGYTTSAREGKGTARTQQNAVKIATLAGQKDGAAEARKLAADFAIDNGIKEVTKFKVDDWHAVIGDIHDIMTPFRSKVKGGEGIAVDLRYNAKLKKLNGIEALINALASKKLTTTNVGTMAPELELLGYRVATIGALTLRRGPADKKGELKQWDEQAALMRDAAVELAEGAHRKDAAAIFSASKRLENSCVECHSNFK